MTDPVPELAAEIAPADVPPAAQMRVGIVAAVEVGGSRRVQLDIGGDTWINRLQDIHLILGDRVSVLQQDPVMLVIGRLEGTDAFTPIGGIIPFAGSAAPINWLMADGSAVSRTTYPDLFAVCGITYGAGDGANTFNIPNMTGKMPIAAGGSYGRGTTGGVAAVTLSSGNLPGHTHTFSGSGSSDNQGGHSHTFSGSGSSDNQGSHGHYLTGYSDSTGGHSHTIGNQGSAYSLQSGSGGTAAGSGSGYTDTQGNHQHSISSGSASSAGGHTHTTTISGTDSTVSGHTHSTTVSGTTSSTGSGNAVTTISPYVAVPFIIRAI
jgi:microcystin-dependent protein